MYACRWTVNRISRKNFVLSFINFRWLETGSNKIRTCALPSGSNIEREYQHRDTKKQKDFLVSWRCCFWWKLFWRGNLHITKHHHQDFRFKLWLKSSARVLFFVVWFVVWLCIPQFLLQRIILLRKWKHLYSNIFIKECTF
jgi:hypothetical protein